MSRALVERDRAQKLTEFAEAESARARINLELARKQQARAEFLLTEAERQTAEAIGSKEKAEQAQADAIKQRDLAEQRGRDLAAQLEETKRAQAYGEQQRQLKEDAVAAASDIEKQNDELQKEISAGLRPEAADLAAKLIAKAKEKGIEIRIIAGYRSLEAQAALYARGRTTPGSIVTAARVSSHNTGLAFDIAVIQAGKVTFPDEQYKILGAMGEELGLIWGGRRMPPDKPHFETKDCQEVLKKLKVSPESPIGGE